MIIRKVYENKQSKQKLVSVPSKSDIVKGDYVMITKVKGEQVMAEENLSAIAKNNTESAHQKIAREINEEIRK